MKQRTAAETGAWLRLPGHAPLRLMTQFAEEFGGVGAHQCFLIHPHVSQWLHVPATTSRSLSCPLPNPCWHIVPTMLDPSLLHLVLSHILLQQQEDQLIQWQV